MIPAVFPRVCFLVFQTNVYDPPVPIVVTGAAGHLGSHVVERVDPHNFQVKGMDIAHPKTARACNKFVIADLTDFDHVLAAFAGASCVVHCASIHPWKSYTDEQYLDNNIKGTWHVYKAAAELNITRIVLTSSIAAIGFTSIPPTAWPVTEDQLFPITDIYSLTKHVQEKIAMAFAEKHGIQTIALRPPAFFPLPELDTGFRLTTNFATVDDMAEAHIAALLTICGFRNPPSHLNTFEPFTITNYLPYAPNDHTLLENDRNNRRLVKKYWPRAYPWLVQQGFSGVGLPAVFDLSKARNLLGWKPRYNFDEWFKEHGPRTSGHGS